MRIAAHLSKSRRSYRDARAAELAAMRDDCAAIAPFVREIASKYDLSVFTITKHIKEIAEAGK